jgi:hypothetical protein
MTSKVKNCEAAQDDHRVRLAALKDIDGIASLKVGTDLSVDFDIWRRPFFSIPDIKLSASVSVYCRQDADSHCARHRADRERVCLA